MQAIPSEFVLIGSETFAAASATIAARWSFFGYHGKQQAIKRRRDRSKTLRDVMEECKIALPKEADAHLDNNTFRYSVAEIRQRTKKDALAIPSAVGDAAVTSILMVRDLLSIDRHFIDAISSMAGQQIHSFADLHAAVADYKYSLLTGVSQHAVDAIQGHVAEQIVGEHLQHLGHHVEFASTSNQAGHDLIVDHFFKVNVKDYAHSNGFSDHFAHHPDIPVIAPFDHAAGHLPTFDAAAGIDHLHAAVHAHDHILTDGGLDHDSVVSHTHHALDAAHGHVPMHFPVVTMCLSTWREGNLLVKGDTDIERSIKNIGLDIAGVGAGGYAGHAAGAAIGTAILPGIGTFLGGLLGGVVGGMLGRSATNHVKYAPLREAHEAYASSRSSLQSLISREEKKAEAEYQKSVSGAESRLRSESLKSQDRIRSEKNRLNDAVQKAATLSDSERTDLIVNVQAALTQEVETAQAEVRSMSSILRFLWPTREYVETIAELWVSKRELRRYAERARFIDASVDDMQDRGAAQLDLALRTGNGESVARKYFRLLRTVAEDGKSKLVKVADEERYRVGKKRDQELTWLQTEMRRIAKQLEDTIAPHLAKLTDVQSTLKSEMAKFGLAH